MIEPAAAPPLVRHVDTVAALPITGQASGPRPVADLPISVQVSGPRRGPVVVVFADPASSNGRYRTVSDRLHVALIRTVLIAPDRRLNVKSVIGLLDRLRITSALLVADQCSGSLAWQLAAAAPTRFTGLVSVDVGHPAVPDTAGVIRDRGCLPVSVNTTALAGSPAAQAIARASGRWVRGDFRLVKRVGAANSEDAKSQLVTEIVLRSCYT